MESQRKETNRVKLFPAHITGEVRMFNKTTNQQQIFLITFQVSFYGRLCLT